MVGRGALQLPNLGAVIARNEAEMPWTTVIGLLLQYAEAALLQPRSDYLASRLNSGCIFEATLCGGCGIVQHYTHDP